jgi:hypothetical protein
METLGTNFVAFCGKKSSQKYHCELCDYLCSKKYNWDKHVMTARHIKEVGGNNLEMKSGKKWQKDQNTKLCICEKCNKEFQTSSGLWKHKQKCKEILLTNKNNINNDDESDDDIITDKKLILMLINQNKELMEIVKNGTNNVIYNNNNNNVNSHNKTFNLQVFLNETCKDAMNISDFIESVQLQVSDLENVGKVGYIEGISNIIIKNLNALEVEKRPVHCTDKKREVMYVKDDNVWEKEDEANKKLRKAIRKIAHKNICMFKAYREKYPDCEEYDSKKNSQYNTIIYESMGGKGDNDYEKDTKIIKKIAKVVGIEKN